MQQDTVIDLDLFNSRCFEYVMLQTAHNGGEGKLRDDNNDKNEGDENLT